MVASSIPLAKQVIQAQSIAVTLDDDQERRFQRLVEKTTMIDLHQHPMVKPEDPSQLLEYLRGDSYVWGYEAVRHGGFTAVGTANVYRGMLNTDEMSFIRFEDLLDEIGMMLSDVGRHDEVVKVSNAGDVAPLKLQEVLTAPGAGGVFFAVHALDRSIRIEVRAHHGVAELGDLSALGTRLGGPDAVHHECESSLLMSIGTFAGGLHLFPLRKQGHGLPASPHTQAPFDIPNALAGEAEFLGPVASLFVSISRVMTSPGLGLSVPRLAIDQQTCPYRTASPFLKSTSKV